MSDNIDLESFPGPKREFVIRNMDTLKVLCDITRQDILRTAVPKPVTVQQIAEALSVPFMRLYYHIKMLIDHQLMQVVYTRKMPGAIEEKYYRATALTFIVDHSLLTFGALEGSESVSKKIEDVRAEIVASLDSGKLDLSHEPPASGSLLLVKGRHGIPKAKAVEFYERLIALYDEFNNTQNSPDDSEVYSLLLVMHPVE